MHARRPDWTFSSWAFCLVIGITVEVVAQLPSGWEDLSPEEFVAAAKEWKATTGGTDPETLAAIAAHAAQLLTATDVVQTATDYGLLLGLYTLGQSELTQQQAATLGQHLANRTDQPETMPFLQLDHKVVLMHLAGVSFEERAAEVAAWIEADQTNFQEVPPAFKFNWFYFHLSYPHTTEPSLSVTWTGKLTAPQTGAYVLSISPININEEGPGFSYRNTWSIVVGGQQVLSATPDNWTTESAAVQLAAGEPVDLRVQTQFAVSQLEEDNFHAMLYWRGPGLSREIIPTLALTTPNGSSNGLVGQYSVTLAGGPQVITRVDPTIDFAWTTGRRIVFAHPQAMEKLRVGVWAKCMDPAYLTLCQQAPETELHPFFAYPTELAGCLSSEQRKTFLNEVVQRPALLEPLSASQMWLFFRSFRLGAEEEAVNMLGLWGSQHQYIKPEMSDPPSIDNFFSKNRFPVYDLAWRVTFQYPPHAERLQEEFLVLENGGCSLPISYILAYSHLIQGRIAEWIALLETQLNDESLTGDQRVSWLIARAMAEEICNGAVHRYYAGRLRLTSGEPWLQEAMLVAESPELQLRAAQERLVRVAALQQWDAWNEQHQAAQQRFAGNAGAQAVLAQWQTAAQEAQANIVAEAEQQAIAARQSQLAALRDRLEHAASRGDVAGQQRLGGLIGELEASGTE